jgi:hypothetical protein
MDPADPKTVRLFFVTAFRIAKHPLSALRTLCPQVRIDLRYMSNVAANGRGGGRFLSSDDAPLAPVLLAGEDGDDAVAGAPS